MTSPADALEGSKRILPECTFTPPNGYKFLGWSYDNKIYMPGESIIQPASNISVTASWERVYQINGSVQQDGSAVNSALVTLMLGSQQVAQTATDENGAYGFDNVKPGIYNLRGEYAGVIQTIIVTITNENAGMQSITLPPRKTNSVVIVEAGAPAVVIGRLEETYESNNSVFTPSDSQKITNGGSVEIKLSAKVSGIVQNNKDSINESANTSDKAVELFIDLDLIKTVTTADGTKTETPVTNSPQIIEAVIQLPAELQGKPNYTVYRVHGNTVDTLTGTPNADGEYITVNSDKTQITVYANKFSTYGVGVGEQSIVTFNANGGSCTPAIMTTNDEGKLTSLPTPTINGKFIFDGWYLDEFTQVTPDTVFLTDTVVTAIWTQKSSGIFLPPVTTCVLKFDTRGGSEIKTITKNIGATVYLSDYETERDGYDFAGWYTDKKLTEKAEFVRLTKNVTVYAKWTKTEPLAEPVVLPFTDVSIYDRYYNDIVYVYENDLMQGTGDGLFSPEIGTTRGMIVMVLYRLENTPETGSICPFDDVEPGSYYEAAITWAADNDIVNGYGNGKFGPEDMITREQLAAIIFRFAQYKGWNTSARADLSLLTDGDSIRNYARDAVSWARYEILIDDIGSGFKSADKASRDQTAAVFHRISKFGQK